MEKGKHLPVRYVSSLFVQMKSAVALKSAKSAQKRIKISIKSMI